MGILANLCWGFSYLTGFDDIQAKVIERMGQSGIIQQFVQFIDCPDMKIRHPINRALGNILTGSDDNTQKVLKLGILSKYKSLLQGHNGLGLSTKERKELCWCLSNICAGPIEDRLAVLNEGIFPILIGMLQNAPFEIQKEALWSLSNATTEAKKEIIGPLVQMGLIKAICMFLQKNMCHSHNRHDKMLGVALECVENILEVGQAHLVHGEENKYATLLEENGGLQYLEELQADDENVSDDVYDKCVHIITKYLGGEDDGGLDNDANADAQLDYGDFGTMTSNNNNNTNSNNNGQFSFGGNDANNNNGSFEF